MDQTRASPEGEQPAAMGGPWGDHLTLAQAYVILRRYWRAVVVAPVLTTTLVAAWLILRAPGHASSTTFVVDASRQPQLPRTLAGLAGQFGVSLGGEGSESPQFYASVITSEGLLRRALLDRFPSGTANAASSMRLVDLLDLDETSDTARLRTGTDLLADRIAARVDVRSGIVHVDVTAPTPVLAMALAARLPQYLNEFNARTRNSRARARREFVQQQLIKAEPELTAAEDRLERFYEQNRLWEGSPQLRFREARLRRQIDIAQEVFVTLKREYETARIEEVNDVPVITVIDPPLTTSRVPGTVQSILYLLGGAAGGLAAGTLLAFVLAFWGRLRTAQQPFPASRIGTPSV